MEFLTATSATAPETLAGSALRRFSIIPLLIMEKVAPSSMAHLEDGCNIAGIFREYPRYRIFS